MVACFQKRADSYLSGKVVEDLRDEGVCDARLVLLVGDADADEAVGAHVHVAHVLVLLHALPLRQGSPLRQDLSKGDAAESDVFTSTDLTRVGNVLI